jgi:hypothetical protein
LHSCHIDIFDGRKLNFQSIVTSNDIIFVPNSMKLHYFSERLLWRKDTYDDDCGDHGDDDSDSDDIYLSGK